MSNSAKYSKFFSKKCGHLLRYLYLSFKNHDCNQNDWNRIVSLVPNLCPNLVRLSISNVFSIPIKTRLFFFQHYGHQLEMICVENVKDTEPDYCDFIIQHLNPKSLRWLYYNRKSQENLDKLVNHFPLMTGLLLNTKRGIPFKPGQPRRKAINFDFLQKLPYLEQFAFSNQAKFNHYNALLASTFSKKLQKLSIEYFGPRPDYSFLYGKFTNLNFLRCLRISLRKDTLPFFALVVDSLPQLEELDISLLLYDQDNHLELMEKYLLMWSKFNKLNTLLLYIRANSFSLKRVFCIQCYLLLVLIFHYAHLIRIVVILFINGFRPFLI